MGEGSELIMSGEEVSGEEGEEPEDRTDQAFDLQHLLNIESL